MIKFLVLWGAIILGLAVAPVQSAECSERETPKTPLAMAELEKALSLVKGEGRSDMGWPRTIYYTHDTYDFRKEEFSSEKRTFEISKKPERIIPHAVGVTEILWAICPHERLVAFNDISADPEFSFIADEIKETGRLFQTRQTELVIGCRPDLVFTVFYSSGDFKEKLRQARIPFFDLGFFGTVSSIKNQVSLIGQIIGEEGNAELLVRIIDSTIEALRAKIPKTKTPTRVVYYDEGGYIPGESSNFTSMCEIINTVNVGAEQGIKSWGQIDFETLLRWDPDVIIVPEGSNLKELLVNNQLLSHARAIKEGKVYYVPGVYLRVDSQYMLLSANLLAGIVYEEAF